MLYFSALLIGILLSIINVKSKLLQFVITTFIVIVLIKLIGGVSILHSFDTSAYAYMYNLSPDAHRFEAGYSNLSYYFYKNSYTYVQFRYFSAAVFMVIMYIAICRFTKNTIFFFTCFAIFPFFIEATQVRNFFMIALVLLGTSILSRKSKFSMLVGSCIIASSALFQISGIIYLLVPFIMLIPIKLLIKICDYLIAIFIFLAILMHYLSGLSVVSKLLSIVASISGRSNTEDMVSLYSQGSSFSTIALYIIAFVFIYLLIRVSWITYFEHDSSFKFQALFSIFVIGILVIPALSGSADFERFLRNGITASIIIFSEWRLKKTISKKYFLSVIISVFLSISLVTTAWKYWDTSSTGRYQYMPYLVQIYKSDY